MIYKKRKTVYNKTIMIRKNTNAEKCNEKALKDYFIYTNQIYCFNKNN